MQAVDRIPVQPWMIGPAATAVFAALAAGGVTARFVGGCVRDAVLGLDIGDLDVCTPAPPERVMELARAAGLRAIPTGIDHGTVTLVADHTGLEVTTLRRDVETDGRRAVVAFTDDWVEDAARRDLTLNALYLDPDGSVYDPMGGGLADARAGRIRFVGDPETRIREDVLRILRFFRFWARFGEEPLDPDGLAACTALADRIPELSGERVWSELSRLLVARQAEAALAAMAEAGVTAWLWPGGAGVEAAIAVAGIERDLELAPDAVRRLAAMVAEPRSVDPVADRLRLSRAESDRIRRALVADGAPATGDRERRARVYRAGAAAYLDARILQAAAAGATAETVVADREVAVGWTPPVFPIGGREVAALGVPPGPDTGRFLRAVEDAWVADDFTGDAAACRARLAALVDQGRQQQ
ncbi:MAG: CCA tRNA nucleotidyltransferase [Thalassobaculum sp.]|uniref:CCA tRNA nucleotidyltransferase n=1 Tax=Thalassobaculum sp. TaxID=2022740 RepID=UPI0032ED0543